MVFEQLLDSTKVKKHPLVILLLSFFYVLVAYGVAYFFFGSAASIVAVFTLTLLLVPALYHLVSLEENIERRKGIHGFFRNHRDFFKIFGLAFLGIVLGLVVISFVLPADLFVYQHEFLVRHHGLYLMEEFAQSPYMPAFSDVWSVFSFNVYVVLICLVLSVFYGAGAVFLIVFNASLFASFFFHVINNIGSKASGLVLFIHFIPELAGFLLVAIAGSILSVAIIRERWGDPYFRNVVQNAVLMFVFSVILLFIAALLEVFVSARVIHSVI